MLDTKMFEDIAGLVEIPSPSVEPMGKYPFGEGPARALDYVLALCSNMGMRTKNLDYYCGWAEIGAGEKLVAMLAHVDVVPAGDGWNTDPYQMETRDGYIYGRGVQDDKGPAIAAIYAMKDIIDTYGEPTDKRIRIIFGCSEEIGDGSDIKKYVDTEELPDFGFTPDADFPVIYGEKGILHSRITFPLKESGIAEISAGSVVNMVPNICHVVLANGTTVEGEGKNAHGSTPENGINAIGDAMRAVADYEPDIPFARFYNTLFGLAYDGSGLNIKMNDEASGPLTASPNVVKIEGDYITLLVDIRYPVTCTREQVYEPMAKRVHEAGGEVVVSCHQDPVYVPADSHLVRTLLAAYSSVTGDTQARPKAIGGGTYAKAMDNIVAFGPCLPGCELTEHQPNEKMSMEDLQIARNIYVEALRSL